MAVDETLFEEGRAAYRAGQYREAAKKFLAAASAEDGQGDGACFHMAGNALMRLRRFNDAATVYRQALRDAGYEKRGSVEYNLGRALAELGDYSEAIEHYDAALADPGFATPWKALVAKGAAYLERGRIEEAARAFRQAAIDPRNPQPSRALVNLGLCFMGLGRPADAVEAYQAALGFEGYEGRAKALANLGIAYAQLARYEDAVRAFERAVESSGHPLTGPAKDAYESALRQVRGPAERVEGWETGEIATVGGQPAQDGSNMPGGPTDGRIAGGASPGGGITAAAGFVVDDEAVSDFFTLTEEEMLERDRAARRARRAAQRDPRARVRALAMWGIAVVALGVALVAAYLAGYGWPTQEDSVAGLVSAYQTGAAYDRFWVAVPDKDIEKEMAKIPPVKEFTIDKVERGSQESVVLLTVVPNKGAPLHYRVTLVREGVGWKVTGIDNDWRSSGATRRGARLPSRYERMGT